MMSQVVSSIGRPGLKLTALRCPILLASSISSRLPGEALNCCNCLNTLASSNQYNTNLKSLSPTNQIPQRYIYSAGSLKIDSLENLKSHKNRIYESGKERYIERIAGYVEKGEIQSIFLNDLINLIGLAENEQHVALIEKIIEKTKDDPSFSCSWGPAVMRVYFSMNLVDRAIQNIKDVERFGTFFDQRASFQIAMTMAYNDGKYNDVVDLHELSQTRVPVPSGLQYKIDRKLSVILYASYAKMNTPEALEKAEQLYYKEKKEDPTNPYMKMRTVTLLSYLAVQQNKPVLAMNILNEAPTHTHTYISIRELKTIALIKLQRFEDVLYHVRATINDIKRNSKVILQEIFDLIKAAENEIEDEKIRDEMKELLVELKESQLVGDEKLASIIFKEIQDYRIFNTPEEGRFNQRFSRSGDSQFVRSDNRTSNYQSNRFNENNRYNDNHTDRFNQSSRFGQDRFNNPARPNQRRSHYSGRNGREPKSFFENDDIEDKDLEQVDFETDKRFR